MDTPSTRGERAVNVVVGGNARVNKVLAIGRVEHLHVQRPDQPEQIDSLEKLKLSISEEVDRCWDRLKEKGQPETQILRDFERVVTFAHENNKRNVVNEAWRLASGPHEQLVFSREYLLDLFFHAHLGVGNFGMALQAAERACHLGSTPVEATQLVRIGEALLDLSNFSGAIDILSELVESSTLSVKWPDAEHEASAILFKAKSWRDLWIPHYLGFHEKVITAANELSEMARQGDAHEEIAGILHRKSRAQFDLAVEREDMELTRESYRTSQLARKESRGGFNAYMPLWDTYITGRLDQRLAKRHLAETYDYATDIPGSMSGHMDLLESRRNLARGSYSLALDRADAAFETWCGFPYPKGIVDALVQRSLANYKLSDCYSAALDLQLATLLAENNGLPLPGDALGVASILGNVLGVDRLSHSAREAAEQYGRLAHNQLDYSSPTLDWVRSMQRLASRLES